MRTLILMSLLLCGGLAEAACVRPGAAPGIPDGAIATDDEMKTAHDAIQGYVNQLEAYQACLKDQVNQAAPDVPTELKATWLAQGDAALDTAQFAAEGFSAALKVFKARSTPK